MMLKKRDRWNRIRSKSVLLFVVLLLMVLGEPTISQAQAPSSTDEPVAVDAADNTSQDNGLDQNSESASGDPSKTSGIPTHPVEVVMAMKYWVVPFVLASIIALWFGIERLVVLRRGRVIPRAFVDRFLLHLEQEKLDAESALKLCEENKSPAAAVFAHGIRKWGKTSVEVEQAIIDGGERQVSQLRKHLRVLNGVATVAPLLGLLGTVVGMIQAFNDIATAGAMGKPEQLAVGIALALLTTAFGLAIAIPSLIMYMYLAGRVDAVVMEMDLLAQNVVHLISAEAFAERSDDQSKPTVRATVGPRSKSKKAV